MASPVLHYGTQGDIFVQLVGRDGLPPNLQGKTVTAFMRTASSGGWVVQRAATVLDQVAARVKLTVLASDYGVVGGARQLIMGQWDLWWVVTPGDTEYPEAARDSLLIVS